MKKTDILIIGAGSAGCTLAARLSENPELQVTLVEAGEKSSYPWLAIPIGYFKTVGNQRFDWGFTTEPEAGMAKRNLPWPRGKGLGGSSLLNGMLYLRGHKADYDQWAVLGLPGWDWDSVLPYFRKSQSRPAVSGETIGQDGPFTVSELPKDPVSDAFITSAGQAGIPETPDFNTGDNEGAGYFQMNIRNGLRMSSARAYLKPAMQRENLQVITGWQATRILFENTRAVGAEFSAKGETHTIRADKEVILCAGAIQSPQLLQLSGVGDPELLAEFAIPVIAELPGVGKNMADHMQVRPCYRCKPSVETLNDVANHLFKGAREFFKYLLFRKGDLRNGVYRAGAFYKSSAEIAWPDVQIHFGLVSFDRPHQPPHPFPGITLSACNLRPHSRGSVAIKSSNPLVPPAIHHGYLQDERDQKLAVAMVRKMREIAETGPLSELIETEYQPGPQVQSDEEILDWVRQRAGSIFHPVSTCAMGPDNDPMAVLDARLKVRKVQALRVVDGAAMPLIVSGNTNAPIIMMAEKAADMIKEDMSHATH
ncbi:MAG: GMC family oxidoreductase N-terminal domain-containing protein [Thiothrix sp.]|nr:GMC family oxidoreductase N-terminal domain-containing protein [Thiothrix sp.]HPE59617.1 GMC family oxidoreductase N-terminal domain-containing protein [Thiolinea sp.]